MINNKMKIEITSESLMRPLYKYAACYVGLLGAMHISVLLFLFAYSNNLEYFVSVKISKKWAIMSLGRVLLCC